MDVYDNVLSKQIVYYEDCIDGMRKHVEDGSIGLIVTSPPYLDIKDYGNENQIGFGQSLQEYLSKMNEVFKECHRILKDGRRFVINVRDVPMNGTVEMDFHIVPLGAYITCEVLKAAPFINVGTVYWHKVGTCNASGTSNAGILGSYPYPPNAHVSFRMEYIFIFKKKEGKLEKKTTFEKDKSKLTKEEWKDYTNQLWNFPGTRVEGHPAAYPIELPKRCIKLWSFVGDTVLDPFLGTGTTLQACQQLKRNGIGFEISEGFKPMIDSRLSKGLTPEFITFHSTKQGKVI